MSYTIFLVNHKNSNPPGLNTARSNIEECFDPSTAYPLNGQDSVGGVKVAEDEGITANHFMRFNWCY